jgi:hypothetical protein
VRGDVETNITFTLESADAKYHGREALVSAVNVDIFWPTSLRIEPELFALGGMNGTLFGGMSRVGLQHACSS